jgi:hypothetical protein
MFSRALAHSDAASLLPQRNRPLGLRTQMMARGPGWRLADGEGNSWMIKLVRCDDPLSTWAHLLRVVRELADSHGLRATVIDLRGSERLSGLAAQAAGLLFAEFENRGIRVAAMVGPDLIHSARLHRILGEHALACGRCFLAETDALEWVRRSVPPIPRPPRSVARSLGIQPPRV